MKVWPYEVVQVKKGAVEARNPCATVDEARARAGRFWDAIVKNRAVAEWHPDAPREARKVLEAWLDRREAPAPLGEVEDTPQPVPSAPVATRKEPPAAPASETAPAPALIQPEGVCAVCGDTPQRHKATLPKVLRLLCKRHRMRAQVLRTQGLSPEAAVAALGRRAPEAAVTALADAPPSRVIELPEVTEPTPEPIQAPPVEEPASEEPTEATGETAAEVYPPRSARFPVAPTSDDVADGCVRVMLGGVPVWGTLVAPGEVEVTGVRLRLALEIGP